MAGPSADIVQRIETGDLPGAPNIAQQPTAGQPADLRARLDTEYVAGGGSQWYTNYLRSLPHAVDDVTTDLGDDTYDKILLDAHAAADIAVLKASILETGLKFSPAKPDADDDGHALSVEICDAATRMFDELTTPTDDVLWDMADAIALGNRVAELVYRTDGANGGPRLVLDAIKVKPRHSTAFVVDTYMNVKGLLGLIPGQGAPVMVGSLLSDPGTTPNLLPREKFAVWTYRPRNNDPRGRPLLRPAYNAWWIKTQLWGQYVKYLTQFAGPSLAGFTAPNAQPAVPTDANGNPTTGAPLSPEQLMLNALLEFQSGTAMAFANGAAVQSIMVPGDGQAFLSAFALLNAEITKAILTQSLATEEGKHSTKAAAGVHKDILDTIVRQGKNSLIRMVRFDILRNWVRWNWGDKAAAELTPNATLGETEREDFASTASAVADLTRYGFLHRSQFTALDERMDLPPRDPDWEEDAAPPLEMVSAQRVPTAEGEGLPAAPAAPAVAAPAAKPAAPKAAAA